MEKLKTQNNDLSIFLSQNLDKPNKTETWARKKTARVTQIFNQPDGSVIKATKISKDGTITDKLENRHK